MKLLKTLNICLDKNLIFAVYRLPQSRKTTLIIQKKARSNKVAIDSKLFEEKGFLVSPFTASERNYSYLISPDIVVTKDNEEVLQKLTSWPEIIQNQNQEKRNFIIGREEFESQVEEIIQAIIKGEFKKAVISRTKIIEGKYRSKITEIFRLLEESYTNAFVYVFNVGGQLWIGATPEPLICSQSKKVNTVSLAGTREYSKENQNIKSWGNKERVEQEYVTLFIENALKQLGITKYKKKGPYTKKAGNLLHLRTDFTLDLVNINGQLGDLLNELHPTSAVCGLPKYQSMKFIHQLEKHNRSYYSGFLGPVNMEEKIALFVNLRCMQVLEDKLVLYVGSGITSDSVPAEEWNETEIKADTLLTIINRV